MTREELETRIARLEYLIDIAFDDLDYGDTDQGPLNRQAAIQDIARWQAELMDLQSALDADADDLG